MLGTDSGGAHRGEPNKSGVKWRNPGGLAVIGVSADSVQVVVDTRAGRVTGAHH